MNETFVIPFVHQRLHVCDMAGGVAMLVLGDEDEASMAARCVYTSPSPPPPYSVPPPLLGEV